MQRRNEGLIDFAIEKLTKLLIEEDFKEKKTNKKTYISKKQAYRDLINILKTIDKFN